MLNSRLERGAIMEKRMSMCAVCVCVVPSVCVSAIKYRLLECVCVCV